MITLLATTDHWADGGHPWFPFFPLIPLLLVIFWVMVIGRFGRFGRRRGGCGRPNAEAVLADRYARGEIDDDEFRTRRAVLRSKP